MRTLTIIQARMSSSRFPGKTLADLNGKPVIQHVIDRLADCFYVGHLIVATSTDPSDDPLVEWCHSYDTDVHRGSLDDVLSRYWSCAKAYGAKTIVRVTADCPMLDSSLLDCTISRLHTRNAAYAATKGWPAGVGQECFTFDALHNAWKHASSPHDREHVVTYMLDHPADFVAAYVCNPEPTDAPSLTLDTPDDLERLRRMLA